jgi:DNA uptake protein ComE-like DNA-binding protein
MLKQLRDILLFSRQERNGILVLLFILLLVVCFDFFLPYLLPVKAYDVSEWKCEVEKLKEIEHVTEKVVPALPDTVINPNSASIADLKRIGIPDGLARTWIKYLQKGGHFKKKEDIRKLYGMSDKLYSVIESQLDNAVISEDKNLQKVNRYIPPKFTSAVSVNDTLHTKYIPRSKVLPIVEINKADSAQLESLPGIGPVLASRIVKYRRLLGGFYKVDQLKEIYGMSGELFVKCAPSLKVDSFEIKKLDINFLSVSELCRHPYVGFKQAKKLVKFRDKTGKFATSEEIVPLFTPDSLHRLIPYLSLRMTAP